MSPYAVINERHWDLARKAAKAWSRTGAGQRMDLEDLTAEAYIALMDGVTKPIKDNTAFADWPDALVMWWCRQHLSAYSHSMLGYSSVCTGG